MLQRFSTWSRVPAAGIPVLPFFLQPCILLPFHLDLFVQKAMKRQFKAENAASGFSPSFLMDPCRSRRNPSIINIFPFFWSSLHILFLQDPLFPEACTSSHGFRAYTLSVQRETRKLSISDLCAKAGNRPDYLQPGSFSWKPHPVQVNFP